mgnify:CR=1 FL=1
MAKRLEVIVTSTGEMRSIHSDEIMPILRQLGDVEVRRASHVEPAVGMREEAKAWIRAEIAAHRPPPMILYSVSCCYSIVWADGIPVTIQGIDQWYADLLPVNGPVLGPCNTKQEALDCEVEWLKKHSYPICPTGNCANAPAVPPAG